MLTIEHPLTGAKLQVANQDFSQEMDWKSAKRACGELGSGWRLPSIEELRAMYKQLHEKSKGNFRAASYWSSKENDDGGVWDFGFNDGNAYYGPSGESCYVRAVRAL